MMSDTHGVAIICEHEGGHTVAWVDEEISLYVPAGYFIEAWFAGQHHVVLAGLLDGGYFTTHDVARGMDWFVEWRDRRKAIAWCKYDARRKGQAA